MNNHAYTFTTDKEYLNEICAIIYYQSSLKEQDRWLNNMIKKGVWNPDE